MDGEGVMAGEGEGLRLLEAERGENSGGGTRSDEECIDEEEDDDDVFVWFELEWEC